MAAKPELIAFSQYKLGGVQSFYHNLLTHDPYEKFEKKWILESCKGDTEPKPMQPYGCCEEIVFDWDDRESPYRWTAALQKLISGREGVVLTNFEVELATLHRYRRKKKTIYYICHDEGYVHMAERYSFLIDVFIAHNPYFFDVLRQRLPNRKDDVFYIPHGVPAREKRQTQVTNGELRIVFAARMRKEKGVYDIPEIDSALKKRNIVAKWVMIGPGSEKESLQNLLMPRGNFEFHTPADTAGVVKMMEGNDIFLLPSRRDGLPVALLEAMSVGCVPVVSDFNPGISRIVTSDVGYVIPTGNLEGMVDAIEGLHHQRLLLQTKSANAQALVTEHFNVDVQARKYFDLFARYKELKKPIQRKWINYGILSHPYVPKFLAAVLRKVRRTVGY